MTMELTLPSSGYTITDLFDIINFITVDATVTSASSTSFSGSGTYDGMAASFTITGSNFSLGTIGGETYVVTGAIGSITFTTALGTVTVVSDGDSPINMIDFAPIIHADETGSAPKGIEQYLMSLDWILNLSDGDDIAPKGTKVGDNVKLNLQGDDVIYGVDGADELYSGSGADWLYGERGADILYGGSGNDHIGGGQGGDRIYGGSGKDIMEGDNGNDVLIGQKGNDELDGGDGHDKLYGGANRDILDGGKGNDKLTGGSESDTFVFDDNYGDDVVTDFDALDNKEKIDVHLMGEIVDYDDLVDNHMSQVGNDVVIDDGANTTITLLNVDIADLSAADFIF